MHVCIYSIYLLLCEGGTGGALLYKMTSIRLLVCSWTNCEKQTPWGDMRPTPSSGTWAHSSVHQRTPGPAGSPLEPRSPHRWQQVHTEHMWQVWTSLETPWWTWSCCNIIYDQFGGSVKVRGGRSWEGHTDLHVTANGSLTAARYQDVSFKKIKPQNQHSVSFHVFTLKYWILIVFST